MRIVECRLGNDHSERTPFVPDELSEKPVANRDVILQLPSGLDEVHQVLVVRWRPEGGWPHWRARDGLLCVLRPS
jgi:hypothetical protein